MASNPVSARSTPKGYGSPGRNQKRFQPSPNARPSVRKYPIVAASIGFYDPFSTGFSTGATSPAAERLTRSTSPVGPMSTWAS